MASLPLFVLKNEQFRNLLTGRFFMILAFRMLATLLGWWIYQLTGDPLAIGFIGLAEVIPAVSCALFAGHVIDNSEKKKMLLICSAAYIILVSLLLLPAFGVIGTHSRVTEVTYFIYAIIFFTGIARAFFGPLVGVIIPRLFTNEELPNAITVNQATFLTASISGHALGGLLIAFLSVKWTLVIIVGLMIMGCVFFVQLKKHLPVPQTRDISVIASIREGVGYIYRTKEILGALCLDMFAVLFGGAVAMIPVFAKDILHVGAEGFGMLNAATDIGAVIIILSLSIMPLKKNQGKILLAAVAAFGCCIIAFGLSRWYWLSFFFLVLSGIVDGVSVVIRGTIVQLKTPENMRGRVLSVNSIFIMSSNEMGQFESGLAARILGTVKSVVFGGCMTVLIAASVGIFNKKLRNMEY